MAAVPAAQVCVCRVYPLKGCVSWSKTGPWRKIEENILVNELSAFIQANLQGTLENHGYTSANFVFSGESPVADKKLNVVMRVTCNVCDMAQGIWTDIARVHLGRTQDLVDGDKSPTFTSRIRSGEHRAEFDLWARITWVGGGGDYEQTTQQIKPDFFMDHLWNQSSGLVLQWTSVDQKWFMQIKRLFRRTKTISWSSVLTGDRPISRKKKHKCAWTSASKMQSCKSPALLILHSVARCKQKQIHVCALSAPEFVLFWSAKSFECD